MSLPEFILFWIAIGGLAGIWWTVDDLRREVRAERAAREGFEAVFYELFVHREGENV